MVARFPFSLQGEGWTSPHTELRLSIGGQVVQPNEYLNTLHHNTTDGTFHFHFAVPQLPAGKYPLHAHIDRHQFVDGHPSHGRVRVTGGGSISVMPSVQWLSHERAGANGGAVVVVYGSGFSSVPSANQVWLAGRVCEVTVADNHMLTCKLHPEGEKLPGPERQQDRSVEG